MCSYQSEKSFKCPVSFRPYWCRDKSIITSTDELTVIIIIDYINSTRIKKFDTYYRILGLILNFNHSMLYYNIEAFKITKKKKKIISISDELSMCEKKHQRNSCFS